VVVLDEELLLPLLMLVLVGESRSRREWIKSPSDGWDRMCFKMDSRFFGGIVGVRIRASDEVLDSLLLLASSVHREVIIWVNTSEAVESPSSTNIGPISDEERSVHSAVVNSTLSDNVHIIDTNCDTLSSSFPLTLPLPLPLPLEEDEGFRRDARRDWRESSASDGDEALTRRSIFWSVAGSPPSVNEDIIFYYLETQFYFILEVGCTIVRRLLFSFQTGGHRPL